MATKRFHVTWLGEYYMDALAVEAVLKNRTRAAEGASLLCAKLQEREEKRSRMVEYLANKREISFEEMWKQLIDGSYIPSDEELKDISDDDD